MPYRPRFTIFTPTPNLRFPRSWSVLDLYEEPAKRRSRGGITQVYRVGRAYLKRHHLGTYGTWRLIRDRRKKK